jgi:hypothetical protein
MKKTLLTAILMAGAASAFSQGAINWGNGITGNANRWPIYGPDPGNPSLVVTGQSSLGAGPAGSTVYGGGLLGGPANSPGSSFTMAFFAGASSSSNTLSLIASTTFRTSTGNSTLPAGLVQGSTVTIPGVGPGQTAFWQARVWNNQSGTITTWAAAEVAWQTGLTSGGVSGIGTTPALGGSLTDGTVFNTPNLTGGTSFNIYFVPEPTSFALAGLGAAALMIFRRRK